MPTTVQPSAAILAVQRRTWSSIEASRWFSVEIVASQLTVPREAAPEAERPWDAGTISPAKKPWVLAQGETPGPSRRCGRSKRLIGGHQSRADRQRDQARRTDTLRPLLTSSGFPRLSGRGSTPGAVKPRALEPPGPPSLSARIDNSRPGIAEFCFDLRLRISYKLIQVELRAEI